MLPSGTVCEYEAEGCETGERSRRESAQCVDGIYVIQEATACAPEEFTTECPSSMPSQVETCTLPSGTVCEYGCETESVRCVDGIYVIQEATGCAPEEFTTECPSSIPSQVETC